MPIDYSKRNPEWLDKIRPMILAREDYKCKFCKRTHKKHYMKSGSMQNLELSEFELEWCLKNKIPVVRIILTIAHLDHNENNDVPENLAALCQKCHLNHDRADNIMRRKNNKARLGANQKNKIETKIK